MAALLALAGCGTVLGHGRSPVALTSYPSGAEVYVDGVHQGSTPMKVSVPTQGVHRIDFKLDGRTGSCEVRGGVSGMWVAIDIAFGLLPLAVDGATGGWHSLDYDACEARFSE
jgi:hypothetical protein